MNEDELKKRTKQFALRIMKLVADESEFWLELIIDGELMKKECVEPLLVEAGELIAIFTRSINTAKTPKNLK